MWLLFGGSGFLGTELRYQLDKLGITYYAPSSQECDIRQPALVAQVIKRDRPDVVVNCAALANVDACEEKPSLARAVNLEGPKNIAKACRELGIFFVHFSSDYVFSGWKAMPYVESDLANPINVYGWTKRLSEEAVQACCPETSLIIRTAWLFSEAKRGFFVYLARAVVSEDTLIFPKQVGSPTYLPDLAETVVKLVEMRKRGIYHVVNAGWASWKTLAAFFLSRYPSKGAVKLVESEKDLRIAKRPLWSVLGTEKLHREAGVSLRPWEEAADVCIRKMLEKSREQL